MKIAIDLTALLPDRTGVDNYLLRLVKSLARVDRRNQYTIYINREDGSLLRLPSNFAVVAASSRSRVVRFVFQQGWLPFATQWRGVDVVHSPSFIMPLYRGRQRHVLTIHDMTTFTLPQCHIRLRRSAPYLRGVRMSIERAHRIIVPSVFVKQEIERVVPRVSDRIRVVPHGIGEEFCPQAIVDAPRVRRELKLPHDYILYVGTIEPRKNLVALIRAYGDLLRERAVKQDLVLAGRPGWQTDEVFREAAAPTLRGKVHFVGYVKDDLLAGLYAGATLFVYPSIAEGFGFPPLEAMACGVPTISTSGSSLAENLEGAAELVSPDDESALRRAIDRLLQDQECRDRRHRLGLARAAEFRWSHAAVATLACYEELAICDAYNAIEAVDT